MKIKPLNTNIIPKIKQAPKKVLNQSIKVDISNEELGYFKVGERYVRIIFPR